MTSISNDNMQTQNTNFNVSQEDWELYLRYIHYRYHGNTNDNPEEYSVWLTRNTII